MKQNIKQSSLRRLRLIEGQVRGLAKMVENDKYCVLIINQSLAIKQALSSLEDLILQNHLSTHAIEQIKSGKKTKAVQEILSIYKLSKRK
ncbi:metal-sensing transcriptional repressor [Candidatus Berkelbacteria bacterium]|nr:metal-sensing transcriptional repressor [Candidatus Berkelbacteria bacterium]MBI4029602.1 metal-sensing transcriptional repressor [Candidatus Berkelbacteria bacterium]